MIDRQQDTLPARFNRVKRTVKWTLLAVGLGVAAMAVNAGCDVRASAESSSIGNLHGFGYDVDASVLGPDIIRITARSTMLPMHGRDTNMARAIERIKRACGNPETVEDASERSRTRKGALIVYASVPNRLACLER